MIKVLFFASLREQLNCDELHMSAADVIDLVGLRRGLFKLHPEWVDFLGNENLLTAVNQSLVKNNHLLTDGDEVAFFPPVTGG